MLTRLPPSLVVEPGLDDLAIKPPLLGHTDCAYAVIHD
jgi:hypothetical protein